MKLDECTTPQIINVDQIWQPSLKSLIFAETILPSYYFKGKTLFFQKPRSVPIAMYSGGSYPWTLIKRDTADDTLNAITGSRQEKTFQKEDIALLSLYNWYNLFRDLMSRGLL